MLDHYKAIFRDRTARALFSSAAVSGLGDFVGLAGLVVLAFERSGSSIGSASLFFVQGIAAVIATTLIGPRLDTIVRARGLMICYAIGAAALVLPTVVGGLWPVMVAAAMVGLLRPSTAALRLSIAGSDMREELLGPVVALQKATGDAAAAVGLATGGLLAVSIGPALALNLDAVTFLFAAALTLQLPRTRGQATERPSPLEGFAIWMKAPSLRLIMMAILGMAAVSALPEALAPEIAGDSPWLAAILASQAVGTAIGGIAIGHRRDLERAPILVAATAATGVTLLIGSLTVGLHPAFMTLANLLLGFALSVMVLGQTAFTRGAPKDRIGAVISSAITSVMLIEGIGALLVGTVSDLRGPAIGYGSGGVVVLLVSGLILLLNRSTLRDPDSHALTAADTAHAPTLPRDRAHRATAWPPPTEPPAPL